jgi:hypothetical protein
MRWSVFEKFTYLFLLDFARFRDLRWQEILSGNWLRFFLYPINRFEIEFNATWWTVNMKKWEGLSWVFFTWLLFYINFTCLVWFLEFFWKRFTKLCINKLFLKNIVTKKSFHTNLMKGKKKKNWNGFQQFSSQFSSI